MSMSEKTLFEFKAPTPRCSVYKVLSCWKLVRAPSICAFDLSWICDIKIDEVESFVIQNDVFSNM